MPFPLFTMLKIAHILAAIVAVGANVTYAVWLARAGRDRERLLFVIGTVRWLERWIATPAYVVLLLTGVGMVQTGAYSFDQGWLRASVLLYAVVAVVGIVLFAPAVRRQLRHADRDPLAPEYGRAARMTALLGLFTVEVVVLIVVLMVAKPF